MDLLIQVAVRYSQHNIYELAEETQKHPDREKLGNFNFTKEDSNEKIYSEVIEPFISSFVDGYDISLVKYGQRNIFYESAINNEDDNKNQELENENEFNLFGGIVQKFIRNVFDELMTSKKDVQFVFSIGWTEINENNQMIDLLNAVGLIQCYTISQLLEVISVGLCNRKGNSSHNILSLILEQQTVNGPFVQQKISTINFCDLNYGSEKIFSNNNFNSVVSEPKDLPTNFYNNAPLPPPPLQTTVPPNYYNESLTNEIATQQWQSLLKNAEKLFAKMNLNSLNEVERKEVEEWLFLKSECDNYLPPPEPQTFYSQNFMAPPSQHHQPSSLLPILEIDENTNEDDRNNDGNESDNSYIDLEDTNNILFEKIATKMEKFQNKADEMVKAKYQEFFSKHPKVLSSDNSNQDVNSEPLKFSSTSSASEQYLAQGRRKSIRDILNSEDLSIIRKAAAGNSENKTAEEVDEDVRPVNNEALNKLDELKRTLKKSIATIDATKLQLKEVEQTIVLKRNLITDLIENNNTRTTAKYKFNKKKSKLESEYEKCKKQLNRALMSSNKNPVEIERLKEMTCTLEQRLVDINSIHHITNESNRKVKQLHNSLQESKKQQEILNKVLKKEIKQKDAIEKEINNLKTKALKAIEEGGSGDTRDLQLTLYQSSQSGTSKMSDNKLKIRDVNARIFHLDEVLKEKATNLQQFGAEISEKESKEKESLRYEIRNLRRTRDHLLEQRVCLYKKLKRDKMLSYKEERKMLECDEAIEAIDVAIEMKNELICGHKSVDTDERIEREKGEQLLMARLNKLSVDEMRILLYKYFLKVIDLKESSQKLEHSLMNLEREKDAWEWREKILTNAIRQARLESERNIVIQQKNHETRLNLLLRHFANETASSSANDASFDSSVTPSSSATALSDFNEFNIIKATKRLTHQNHPLEDPRNRHPYAVQKYDHRQMHHQQEQHHFNKDIRNKLFTKFHILTYHQGSSSTNDETALIPQENLKQLKSKKPGTKVTRQKNKLIIQQDDPDETN